MELTPTDVFIAVGLFFARSIFLRLVERLPILEGLAKLGKSVLKALDKPQPAPAQLTAGSPGTDLYTQTLESQRQSIDLASSAAASTRTDLNRLEDRTDRRFDDIERQMDKNHEEVKNLIREKVDGSIAWQVREVGALKRGMNDLGGELATIRQRLDALEARLA